MNDLKTCTKCKVSQAYSEFLKNKRYKDGYVTWCKGCKRQHQRENPHHYKNWCTKNPEQAAKVKQTYVDRHPEKVKVTKQQWAKANPKKVLANTRKYQAAKINATPSWLTDAQIREMEEFYVQCPPGFEVDHIIPLRGKNVSGLHVPWNLQLMETGPNRRKSNKY